MSRRAATAGEPNPHHEHAKTRAAEELARRLQQWLPDSLRQGFSERFVEDMVAEGWRHIPPTVNWRASGGRPADPDTARRRVEEIRRSLPPGKGRGGRKREPL